MKTIVLFIRRFLSLKYLLLGFCIALVIQISNSCWWKDKPDSEDQDNPEYVDVGKLEEGIKAVEDAFLSGNVEDITNMLTEEATEIYGNSITNAKKEQLVELGEALKTQKLKVFTDMYSEFNYTKDGIEYSMALARKEDGSWKLMRF